MIYIVTIFMLTIQVGSQFPNITNKVKRKCMELVFPSKKFNDAFENPLNLEPKQYFMNFKNTHIFDISQ